MHARFKFCKYRETEHTARYKKFYIAGQVEDGLPRDHSKKWGSDQDLFAASSSTLLTDSHAFFTMKILHPKSHTKFAI